MEFLLPEIYLLDRPRTFGIHVHRRSTNAGESTRNKPQEQSGDTPRNFRRRSRCLFFDLSIQRLTRSNKGNTHGLLILAPAEMDQLVSELDQLAEPVRDREIWSTLSDVRGLAERCRDLDSSELHFEGD